MVGPPDQAQDHGLRNKSHLDQGVSDQEDKVQGSEELAGTRN